MFSNKTKYLVSGGFAGVLFVMLAVTLIGYSQITDTVASAGRLVSVQNQKTNLLVTMYAAARERSVVLLRMVNQSDAEALEEDAQYLHHLALRYVTARGSLSALLTAPGEIAELEAQRELTTASAPLQLEVADLLMLGFRIEALEVLINRAIPAHDRVAEHLNSMLGSQQRLTEQAIAVAQEDSRGTFILLGFMILFAAVVAIGVAVYVVRKTSRAEEAVFAQVTLEAIGDAVIASDEGGRVSYLNAQAQSLLGLTAEQALGRPLAKVFACVAPDELEDQGALCTSREGELRAEDGSSQSIELLFSPIRDRNQHALGSVVVFRDISERKQMEEQLRRSEERFSLVMRGTNDGVWDYNLKSGEIYLSPRWKAMLGYQEHEFENTFHDWQRHIHPSDLGNILEVWTDCMNGQSDSFSIEYRMENRDGEWIWVECRGLALLDDMGLPIRLAGSHTDISERKVAEEQLLWNSTHDSLTGLINRSHFEMRLDQLMKLAHRSSVEHALLYIDLDQFKVVNDTCGHIAGDELLRQVSALLTQSFRDSDLLARLGGDEFGIILEDCNVAEAMKIGETVREIIKEYRFAWDNKVFEIGASIGVATITRATASRTEVLSAADIACYAAKDLGRNRVHLYTESDDQLAVKHREMRWVSRISKALKEERFVLYCQSILPIEPDRSAAGNRPEKPLLREILVRMLDEEGELVPPNYFIPAAERYNLMPAVDRWVVRNLFASLQREAEQSGDFACPERPAVVTTVNLSGSSINDAGFQKFIKQQFETFKVCPQSVCFEITETAAIANLAQASVFINALKAIGCRFALDDFGSGLSSFGYLKNLPVDYLKIDGQFVKDIERDPIDAAMVRSINEIGQVMGMMTIAEFVENDAILERLTLIGVDYAQGYGIARPMPLEQVFAQQLKVAT